MENKDIVLTTDELKQLRDIARYYDRFVCDTVDVIFNALNFIINFIKSIYIIGLIIPFTTFIFINRSEVFSEDSNYSTLMIYCLFSIIIPILSKILGSNILLKIKRDTIIRSHTRIVDMCISQNEKLASVSPIEACNYVAKNVMIIIDTYNTEDN